MAKHTLISLFGALALAASLVMGAVPATAQSEGTISGIVYADRNATGSRDEGDPGIKDARVSFATADGWSTVINTADDGSFSINLNPATYTVSVIEVPPGYFDVEVADVTVEVIIRNPGDTHNLSFGIVPEGTALPASGGPVPGAVMIAGLVVLLALGATLVMVGQRRSKNALA